MGDDWRAILEATSVEVYKADRRSRVWRVSAGAAPVSGGGAEFLVVKRFEHAPLRQRVQWWLGVHPAQRERRMHRALQEAGLPAAPVLAWGVEPAGWGVRAWMVQPWLGPSLHYAIRNGRSAPMRTRRAVAQSLAQLVAALIAGRWHHRDLKSSNLILGADGRTWLIDGGAIRRGASSAAARARQVQHMLRTLDAAATRAGATRADRRRTLNAIVECLRQERFRHTPDAHRIADALTRPRHRAPSGR